MAVGLNGVDDGAAEFDNPDGVYSAPRLLGGARLVGAPSQGIEREGVGAIESLLARRSAEEAGRRRALGAGIGGDGEAGIEHQKRCVSFAQAVILRYSEGSGVCVRLG